MRVLLVALGAMGQRYRKVLENTFGWNLTLVTVDPRTPENTANIQHYSDISEVPSDMTFDLAIDARPNLDRLGMFKHFMVRNIPNLIIEKPLAASIEEANAIVSLYEGSVRKPRILTPFYRRFAKPFSKSVLAQLHAGELRGVVISAGAVGLGCVGIHYIDLANYLFDSVPTRISAQLQLDTIPSPRGRQFRDHAGTLVTHYPKGRLVLDLHDDSAAGGSITLIYERGKIQCLDQRGYAWYWFRQAEELSDNPYYKTHLESAVEPPCPYVFQLEEMMADGIDALLGGQIIPTLYDGYNALKCIALAIRSSETGQALAWENEQMIHNTTFQFT